MNFFEYSKNLNIYVRDNIIYIRGVMCVILVNLKLDNILSFSNFTINFSYPKKVKNFAINNENLENLNSFRYKKLNIFLGSNASGKSSLLTCIWKIMLFLSKGERSFIDEIVNNNYKESYIEVDFVTNLVEQSEKKYLLNRVKIKIDNLNCKIKIACIQLRLNQGDSYENRAKDLNQFTEYVDYLEFLNKHNFEIGWHTALPATEPGFDIVKIMNPNDKKTKNEYLFIVNQVLKTLDSSIINVSQSKDSDDAFVIEHESAGKIIVQHGNKLSTIPYLSSGTKYGFNIANLLFSIKTHNNGVYLIDEQFSYVNSDIEIAILNTMVSLLGPDEQIFFTTHNLNVLEIKFPFHSFNFLKKENLDERIVIKSYCASLVENRNNTSAKSIIDNDMLATAPDVNKIYEIGEDDE